MHGSSSCRAFPLYSRDMAAKSAFGGGALRSAAAPARDRDWVSPRITARDLPRFAGAMVIIAGKATDIDEDLHTATFECLVTGTPFVVQHTPPGLELATKNECTCQVDAAGNQLSFVEIAHLTDDFDGETYGKLIGLMHNHHRGLFF